MAKEEPSGVDRAKRMFAASLARESKQHDEEEQMWAGRFSNLAMIGSWATAGAITLAVMVAGLIFSFDRRGWLVALGVLAALWVALLVRLLYQQYCVHYSLTSQRLIHERGILWKHVDRIEAIDIDDVTFRQGPIGRMFGVGTVRIVSSDASTPEFHLVGIDNVREVAGLIDKVRRQERRKRGLHIETV